MLSANHIITSATFQTTNARSLSMLRSEETGLIQLAEAEQKRCGDTDSFKISFPINSNEYYGASTRDIPTLQKALKAKFAGYAIDCLLPLRPWEREFEHHSVTILFTINTSPKRSKLLAEEIASFAGSGGIDSDKTLKLNVSLRLDIGSEVAIDEILKRCTKFDTFFRVGTIGVVDHSVWTHAVYLSENEETKALRLSQERVNALSKQNISKIGDEFTKSIVKEINESPLSPRHSTSLFCRHPEYWEEMKEPLLVEIRSRFEPSILKDCEVSLSLTGGSSGFPEMVQLSLTCKSLR